MCLIYDLQNEKKKRVKYTLQNKYLNNVFANENFCHFSRKGKTTEHGDDIYYIKLKDIIYNLRNIFVYCIHHQELYIYNNRCTRCVYIFEGREKHKTYLIIELLYNRKGCYFICLTFIYKKKEFWFFFVRKFIY